MEMGKRIVDGEAIWRSQKLKKVPEKYRAEYANLIPLAEANGCFECDAHAIWADVYSYNRPNITVEDVENMLTWFENAEMIQRYENDGRVFATFVGIEKPGRLPGPAAASRYQTLPPSPPRFEDSRPVQNLPIEGLLDQKTLDVYGFFEERKSYNKELKAAVKRFGYDTLLESYDSWLAVHPVSGGKRPVSAFLRGLGSGSVAPQTNSVSSPNLQKTEDAIALRSDNKVFFQPNQRIVLAGLIQEYGDTSVLEAFDDFFTDFGDDNLNFAAKNFVEQAGTRIRTMLKKIETEKKEVARLEKSRQAAIIEAQTQLLRDAETEPEDDLG